MRNTWILKQWMHENGIKYNEPFEVENSKLGEVQLMFKNDREIYFFPGKIFLLLAGRSLDDKWTKVIDVGFNDLVLDLMFNEKVKVFPVKECEDER